MADLKRRIAVTAVAIATVVAGTLFSVTIGASPAQAACRRMFSLTFHPASTSHGPYLHASNWRYCWDPDSESYYYVAIMKLVGQTWTKVAEGTGWANYQCQGTTPTWYLATTQLGGESTGSAQFNCG